MALPSGHVMGCVQTQKGGGGGERRGEEDAEEEEGGMKERMDSLSLEERN